MQKKIIALAIAAAMAAPAVAMAEATVYGQMNMAYEVVDTGDSTTGVGTAKDSRNMVSSNVSRLGVKGSEDLGNGMTAVFQMEGEVMGDDGTSNLFGRNTFLGVAGGFGTVVLGNHDTMYKMSTRDMDVFKDSIADNRSLMGANLLDYRASDVLAYVSPDFSGFSFAAAMVGETDNGLYADLQPTIDSLIAPATLSVGTTTMSATTLSAQYGMDNWKAVLGYIGVNVKDSALPLKLDITGTKIGGTYSMDAFSVNAIYEMLSFKADAGKMESNNIYVSGTYNVSDAGKLKLAYTMAGEWKDGGATVTGSGATQMSLGYDHAMTKNTTLFALYSAIGNDTAATYGFTSGGSTGDMAGGATADMDPTAIAIGIRHSF